MAKFERRLAGNVVVGPQTDVTAENWTDRAKAFIASKGSDALGFVIANGNHAQHTATEPQWIAWTRWLDHIGVKTRFAESHGIMTVPCEWPEDFALDCPPSNRAARLPRRFVTSDIDRKATADAVRKATAHLEAPKQRRREPWRMTPDQADEYMREIAARPVAPLSAAALGRRA